MSDARRLVDKLWSYCNVLRDDGVGTIEYTEQLTYLLFLKMAHEREIRALNPERIVPENCSWQRLLDPDGDDLEVTYRHILEDLGKQPGTLGAIFRKAHVALGRVSVQAHRLDTGRVEWSILRLAPYLR